MQTTPVNRTESGKELVEIMAYGCIEYMLEHGIPLTPKGFEVLVKRSRDSGLNGRIAFQQYDWTQRRMQELFRRTSGLPAAMFQSGNRDRLIGKTSIRNRLLVTGLHPGDSEAEVREGLERIRRHLGDEMADLIEALRYGDCQRELVWEKIHEISRAGDARAALRTFKHDG